MNHLMAYKETLGRIALYAMGLPGAGIVVSLLQSKNLTAAGGYLVMRRLRRLRRRIVRMVIFILLLGVIAVLAL